MGTHTIMGIDMGSHMGLHMEIHVGIYMETHIEINTEILWEWDRNRNGNSPPTATLEISQYERIKLASNKQLLICGKSKLYFELGITIVPRMEITMNKSTDIEPKVLSRAFGRRVGKFYLLL